MGKGEEKKRCVCLLEGGRAKEIVGLREPEQIVLGRSKKYFGGCSSRVLKDRQTSSDCMREKQIKFRIWSPRCPEMFCL